MIITNYIRQRKAANPLQLCLNNDVNDYIVYQNSCQCSVDWLIDYLTYQFSSTLHSFNSCYYPKHNKLLNLTTGVWRSRCRRFQLCWLRSTAKHFKRCKNRICCFCSGLTDPLGLASAWLFACKLNESRSVLRSRVSYFVYATVLPCVYIQQAGLYSKPGISVGWMWSTELALSSHRTSASRVNRSMQQ